MAGTERTERRRPPWRTSRTSWASDVLVERKRRTYLFAMLMTLPFLPYLAFATRDAEPLGRPPTAC